VSPKVAELQGGGGLKGGGDALRSWFKRHSAWLWFAERCGYDLDRMAHKLGCSAAELLEQLSVWAGKAMDADNWRDSVAPVLVELSAKCGVDGGPFAKAVDSRCASLVFAVDVLQRYMREAENADLVLTALCPNVRPALAVGSPLQAGWGASVLGWAGNCVSQSARSARSQKLYAPVQHVFYHRETLRTLALAELRYAVTPELLRSPVTANELETLLPMQKVANDVVCAYFVALAQTLNWPQRVGVASPHFGSAFVVDGIHPAVTVDELRRLFDRVLIPCIVAASHWVLFVVDFEKDTVRSYDSLAMPAVTEVVAGRMQRFFGIGNKAIEAVSQQDNGTDCGVFVCGFATQLLAGRPVTFCQGQVAEFRVRICTEIVALFFGNARPVKGQVTRWLSQAPGILGSTGHLVDAAVEVPRPEDLPKTIESRARNAIMPETSPGCQAVAVGVGTFLGGDNMCYANAVLQLLRRTGLRWSRPEGPTERATAASEEQMNRLVDALCDRCRRGQGRIDARELRDAVWALHPQEPHPEAQHDAGGFFAYLAEALGPDGMVARMTHDVVSGSATVAHATCVTDVTLDIELQDQLDEIGITWLHDLHGTLCDAGTIRWSDTPDWLLVRIPRGLTTEVKDFTSFDLPADVTVPGCSDGDRHHRYGLRGVVIHRGADAASGHYYAVTKESAGWFVFDDHQTPRPVSWEDLSSQARGDVHSEEAGTIALYEDEGEVPGDAEAERSARLAARGLSSTGPNMRPEPESTTDMGSGFTRRADAVSPRPAASSLGPGVGRRAKRSAPKQPPADRARAKPGPKATVAPSSDAVNEALGF
jgi:hypothetical protein